MVGLPVRRVGLGWEYGGVDGHEVFSPHGGGILRVRACRGSDGGSSRTDSDLGLGTRERRWS